MSFLIDGNNVMGQRVGWHKDKPAARRKLMDDLAAYAAKHGLTISVVFDGAPEIHFADGSRYRGIGLFYAERGSNADERIKRIVENSRQRQTLCVVTSDRALTDYVRRCGARVVRSGDFRKKMDATLAVLRDSVAPEPSVDGELDEWMRYFGAEADE